MMESDHLLNGGSFMIPPEDAEGRKVPLKTKIISRLRYYIPIVSWLPNYKIKEYLVGDLIAGLSVAVMIIPQSLAYSTLAGLPPIYGLYTAFVPVIMYLIFGTSKHISIGPEAVLSILIGVATANAAEEWTGNENFTVEDRIAVTGALTFMVGIFTLLLGLFRVGFIDNLFSRPLLTGFVTALACLTIIEQSDTVMGIRVGNEHSWFKVLAVLQNLEDWNPLSFGIWCYSIVLLLVFKVVKKYLLGKYGHTRLAVIKFIPEILIVVVIGILLSIRFDFGARGVALLGTFDTRLPTPRLPILGSLELWQDLSIDILVVTLIGFIEAIIVVRTFAIKHGYAVSANRELVAYGLQNIVGSFFGSYPTFGSLSRTAMNDQAGVKTQLSGFIISGIVCFTIALLMPFFEPLPKPVMAAVVVYAAIGLFEQGEIKFLIKIRAWRDLFILVATALITIILGAEVGVVCCVAGSLFMIVHTSMFPPITIRGRDIDTGRFVDIYVCTDINLFDANHKWFKQANVFGQKGILVVRIDGSLSFYNAPGVKMLLWKMEQKSDIPLSAIVLDMKNIYTMDSTAIQTLMDLIGEYRNRNIAVSVVKIKPQVKQMFLASGLLSLLGANNIFAKTVDAVTSIEKAGKFTHSTYQDSIRYEKSPAAARLQRYDEKPNSISVQLSPPSKHNTEEIDSNSGSINNTSEKQGLLGKDNNQNNNDKKSNQD